MTQGRESSSPLEGRVALVTGAGRGIGRACAMRLAGLGANTAVTDLVTESDLRRGQFTDALTELALQDGGEELIGVERTVEQIRASGGTAIGLRLDVADDDEVDAAFRAAEDEWGSVDILVNNAAVFDNRARFEDLTADHWHRDIEVNLMGVVRCTRRAWHPMQEKGWGRVVNISSMAGVLGSFGQASYSTTKSALFGLTKTLALEGARAGITVNTVAPGPISTGGFERKEELNVKSDVKDRIIHGTAMRRTGRTEEIAGAVAYFASTDAGYTTGQVLNVCGGLDLFVY